MIKFDDFLFAALLGLLTFFGVVLWMHDMQPHKLTNRVQWTQETVQEPTWVNQAANNRNLAPKTDFAGTKLGPCDYLVNCGR